MDRTEWHDLLDRLRSQGELIQTWNPEPPHPTALRCEQSRHRTLAHLRACQEQWLAIARRFLQEDSPRVTILHPWRLFDIHRYAEQPWSTHLEKFTQDREAWLALREVDCERGGKWNRKPDTIGGLTKRLADHERHHIGLKSTQQ